MSKQNTKQESTTQTRMQDETLQNAREALRQQPGSLACVTALSRLLLTGGSGDSQTSEGDVSQSTGRAEAEKAWRGLIAAAPTNVHIMAAARQWANWQDTPLPEARILRLALIGTGTLQPVAAHVRVECAAAGLHPQLWTGEFNQWAQELLTENSGLYRFAPDVIAMYVAPETLFPLTITGDVENGALLEAEQQEGLEHILTALRTAANRLPNTTFLLHTFAAPDYAPKGIRDLWDQSGGQRERVEHLNRRFVNLLRGQIGESRVLLLDQERVEARFGKRGVRDERLWYLGSVPFADAFLPNLSSEYMRLLRPLLGLTRKCIVLDLDNTLWGGVVGEDQAEHLKLGGSSAPGNAFYEFQKSLLHLQQERGILLALCSKNNESDVWPVLETHPFMLLRRQHFAAVRVNWEPKPVNLRAIARELNIGLDSLAFLDDNPAERALMRQELPEVLTVEMPRDPALYVKTLTALDAFELLHVTEEDRRRAQLYREQQDRKAFEVQQQTLSESQPDEKTGTGLTEYLQKLGMQVQIASANSFALPRIAQLINKTNQFNMTTRRYTEAQVRTMMETPDLWHICSVSVSDRFGDSGLTGVAIVRKNDTDTDKVWEIDSFLLSCRVLGRGIEDALLTHIIRAAQEADVQVLRAQFIPTAKNEPANGFFVHQGWSRSITTNGTVIYEISPATADASFPAWLQIDMPSVPSLAASAA